MMSELVILSLERWRSKRIRVHLLSGDRMHVAVPSLDGFDVTLRGQVSRTSTSNLPTGHMRLSSAQYMVAGNMAKEQSRPA